MATHILLVGKMIHGETHWDISPLPEVEETPLDGGSPPAGDGKLQRLLDEAEMTADYEEDILDREDWSRGQW